MSRHTSAELVLSPRAQRVGGELARIMSDSTEVARYASGNVKRKDRRAIGELVANHPKLNTEQGVGGLIWLASFHGEPIGRWIDGLVEDYSLDEVLLAIEFLYDEGVRTSGNSVFKDENEEVREYVPLLLELLQYHKELEYEMEIRSVEQLEGLVTVLGGLKAVGDYDSAESIVEALTDYRSRRD